MTSRPREPFLILAPFWILLFCYRALSSLISTIVMDPSSSSSSQKLSIVFLFLLIRVISPFRTFYTGFLRVRVGWKSGGRSSPSHSDFLLYFPYGSLFSYSTPFKLFPGFHSSPFHGLLHCSFPPLTPKRQAMGGKTSPRGGHIVTLWK